jgi:hypothetical protein
LKNVILQASDDAASLPEPGRCDLDRRHVSSHRPSGKVLPKLTKSRKRGGRLAIIDFKPDSPEGQSFDFSPEKVGPNRQDRLQAL